MPVDPLELDGATFAAVAEEVAAAAAAFIDARRDAPASVDDHRAALVDAVSSGPPEGPTPVADVLARLAPVLVDGLDTAGGGYLGYIPGGGVPAAAAGEVLAAVANRYTGLAFAAPAAVALEQSVVRWLAASCGLPDGAGGVLTSGGSVANLAAVVAARHDRLDGLDGATLYVSDQAHHSVAKAARIAGFGPGAVRVLPSDGAQRLDADAVREAVHTDREAGLHPFLLVASAGTTNTGAVDPLTDLADVAAAEGLWFHVDGAYGGAFVLTERGRSRLAGIERADTVTLDPHKGLFLPYGTGALLARDPARLAAAHAGDAAYLHEAAGGALPDFADLSVELSRPARGIPLWFALHLHGVAAFRAALDEKLDLAEHAAAALGDVSGVTVTAPPDLSIVAFTADAGDAATRAVLAAVNAERRVFLSSTTVSSRLVARLAILSFRTHREHVDAAVDGVARAVDALRP